MKEKSMKSEPFEDDLSSRKEFADRLFAFLSAEQQFVDGALVVTLQASFGSGKTYFLQNWMKILEGERKANPEIPRVIFLNAWESDYCGDPLLALISAIYRGLGTAKAKERLSKKIGEALKDVAYFGLGMGNSFIHSITGVDSVESGEYAKGKKEERRAQENMIPDVLASLDKKREAFETIKAALKELFEGETMKAIVMVDELDRCRPDYAISYLETIKHIFDIHGMVFILALDHSQLQATAKSLFGTEMNFDEYLRKFVQRRINLPEIADGADRRLESGMGRMIDKYIEKYVSNDMRQSLFHDKRWGQIDDVFSATRPNFRQAQEISRIIGYVLSYKEKECEIIDYELSYEEKERKLAWCSGVAVVFLSTISVTHPDSYREISGGIIDFQATCEVIDKIIKNLYEHKKKTLMKILAIGHCTYFGNDDRVAKILKTLQHLGYEDRDKTSDAWRKENDSLYREWGYLYNESNLLNICSHIDDLKILLA